MTPTTQSVIEAVSDRVVGIALIIGLCYCWRQTCLYWEKRPKAPYEQERQ